MEPIRVLDADFNLLGEIDEYSSLQWIRRWYKPGEFELHTRPDAANADVLQEDTIVFKAKNSAEAGTIDYRGIELNENGEEELVIRGKFLAGLLSRRITIPPAGSAYDVGNGAVESIMKQYVNANAIAPADTNRIIPYLLLAADQARGGLSTYQTRYKVLSDELETMSVASGLGWGISLDAVNRSLVFDVYEGRDVTAEQQTLPPAIFSTEFDNIKGLGLTISSAGYQNTAYVGGQGEGVNRTIVLAGGGVGLARREVFIDARDIGTTEPGQEPLTAEEEQQMLLDRGNQSLQESAKIESLEAEVLTVSNLIYRVDFDLGDIVTIRHKRWGVTMNARITEIKEIIEPSGFKLEITFGNSFPTFTEILKRKLR